MIGTRTGGVDSQHAEIKLIPQPAAVVNDTTADQIYDVTGVGPQLKDKSGVAFPLIVGADGIGVAGVAFANTPYTCAVLDRVVLVDTTLGAISVLLPSTANIRVGHAITFVDKARNFGTNALTLDGNTKNINSASTLVCGTTDGGVTVIWGGTTWEVNTGTAGVNGWSFGTPQSLSGAGAVNVTTFATLFTSTGAAQALTMANGTRPGQVKFIMHVVDGGSGVLTPTTKTGFTTLTLTAVYDWGAMIWDGAAWRALAYGGTAAFA